MQLAETFNSLARDAWDDAGFGVIAVGVPHTGVTVEHGFTTRAELALEVIGVEQCPRPGVFRHAKSLPYWNASVHVGA